ncbi:hypothetical protein [Micromonospora sp. WMMD737]|uniref:hypothetical protein n=1 Tax=Micromonospora sp. WMMD737 TaxID=3404113 RepID=UPI003B9649B0
MPNQTTSPPPAYGTTEHAHMVAGHRWDAIHDGLQWLTYGHLPPPLRPYSAPFYAAAVNLLDAIGTDSPELTTAINGLVAAKDSAVRAGIRHTTGRAGSVPRPQAVIHPPGLSDGNQ